MFYMKLQQHTNIPAATYLRFCRRLH